MNISTLTAQQVESLTALGQVWGFLKYYHPAVAAGQRNWDADLFAMMPKVMACANAADVSAVLSQWVTSLGPVVPCPPCAAPPTRAVRVAPDLAWLSNTKRFSPQLRQQLLDVQTNRYQGPPHYVGRGPAGNPTFPNEAAYPKQVHSDAGLRILALFRYWNIVQYYFPYKYAIGEDWSRVLPEFLPQVVAARNAAQYRETALRLFARIHDSHANTLAGDTALTATSGSYVAPVALQFLDGRAVVLRVRQDGAVPRPPLEPGDVVERVDGVPVATLVRQRQPLTPGSNEATQLRNIAQDLLRGSSAQVSVQVSRAGKTLTVPVPRYHYATLAPVKPAASDTTYRFLSPTVGYVTMASITKAKLPVIMKAFAQTRGLVVDMRNYPREFVSYLLLPYFITQPTPFAKFSTFNADFPGQFTEVPMQSYRPSGNPPYAGRLVVLVNELTQSQAEFNAMALRATPHCTVLGSQTAGADGDVSRIVLPGNLTTRISGLGVYYPDGRETQRVGIVPDVVVRPTVAGLRAGRDELLERAVALINESK